MSLAVEHALRHTTIDSAQLLDEEKKTMAHVKVLGRWEDGKPTQKPPDAKIKTHSGGGDSTHSSQPCTYMTTYKLGL